MSTVQAKKLLAKRVVSHCQKNLKIGLGAGSTVMYVVDALAEKFSGSMQIFTAALATQKRCLQLGIAAELMTATANIDVYIDGADEVSPTFCCIKGRGGMMTGESLCVEMAQQFIVVVEDCKVSQYLGQIWPTIAVEVVSWARSSLGRAIVKMGGRPILREQKSELGNYIIDCYDLDLANPGILAREISQMTGVVGHGLFVKHKPDIVYVSDGIRVWTL